MPYGCIPRCHDLVPPVLDRNLPMLGQAGGLEMVSNYACSFELAQLHYQLAPAALLHAECQSQAHASHACKEESSLLKHGVHCNTGSTVLSQSFTT